MKPPNYYGIKPLIEEEEPEHLKELENRLHKKNIKKECKLKDLEVGDRVKVIRKAKTEERGWQNCWEDYMDFTIGKTGVISEKAGKIGVNVCFRDYTCWYYPPWVLEKIKR